MSDPKLKGAPIDMFLKVAKTLDGDLLVTPELMNRLIGVASDLHEIEQAAKKERP